MSLPSPFRQLHWAYLVSVNAWLLLSPAHLLHDYRNQAIPLVTSMWDPRNLCTLVTLATLLLLSRLTLIHHHNLRTRSECTEVKVHKNRSGSSRDGDAISHSVLLIGLMLSVIPFLPASNLLFPVGFVVAERVLYLPSMGFCLIIGYSAHRMATSHHRLVSGCTKVGLACLILSHSAKTVTRNRDWSSPLSLYSSLLRECPGNGPALVNMARAYRGMGDVGRAELAYRHAMKVSPHLPDPYVNLGSMLNSMGHTRAAEEVNVNTWCLIRLDWVIIGANGY